MGSEMDEQISNKEKRDIAIQSLIEAIPYVGGSISTLYFGSKQEKRFKRIENFYSEMKKEIESIQKDIVDIGQHNPDELSAILEELHEKIETEHLEVKRKYYKQYFKSTLKEPVKNNYDERKIFLDILSDLTPLQIELLTFIVIQNNALSTNNIRKPGVDQSLTIGAINKLKTTGLISTELNSISFTNVGGSMDENVRVSPFGKRFHDFCIK